MRPRLVSLSFLTLLVALATAGSAYAAFPGQNGKIVYVDYVGSQQEIFTVNLDGTGETRLTNNAGDDVLPAWSPDGTEIVFFSDRNGTFDLYTMNADGTGVTNITNTPGPQTEWSPAWSPDGQRIAFSCGLICVMNRDGTGRKELSGPPPPPRPGGALGFRLRPGVVSRWEEDHFHAQYLERRIPRGIRLDHERRRERPIAVPDGGRS